MISEIIILPGGINHISACIPGRVRDINIQGGFEKPGCKETGVIPCHFFNISDPAFIYFSRLLIKDFLFGFNGCAFNQGLHAVRLFSEVDHKTLKS